MTKEVNLSAPEFTVAQVETKISLMRMLKNSTEILIVIAKIAVVAIDNDVMVGHQRFRPLSFEICPGHKLAQRAE